MFVYLGQQWEIHAVFPYLEHIGLVLAAPLLMFLFAFVDFKSHIGIMNVL